MKLYIPLFIVLAVGGSTVGCATSTNDLHAEAMGCGKELVIEPNGIVRKPTEQEKADQCVPAWKAYNKRLESNAKAEERKKLASQCCIKPNGKPIIRCKCISGPELREALRRAGYY